MSVMSLVIRKINHVIHGQRGALAPAFAIILPILLSLMALGLDGANGLYQKARLSDAMDEAALAVASSGKTNTTVEESNNSKALVKAYLNYYIPSMTREPIITFSSQSSDEDANDGLKYIDYHMGASVYVPAVFDVGTFPGFDHEIQIGTHDKKVRKFSALPADYVFVVDFSTSQAGTPMKILKSVVKEITEFAIENNKNSKIAIVPFSTGVSVKLPGVNERGGERAGCSVLFVPNKDYDINYEFWSDKYVGRHSTYPARMYYMDYWRYYYYYHYVRASAPAMTVANMQSQWCVKNAKYGTLEGVWQYTCKTNEYPHTDIFSAASQRIIKSEYDKAYRVQSEQNSYLTIEHDKAINYEATLEQMFSEEAIKTFVMPWAGMQDSAYRAYNRMCHQAGWYNHTSGNSLVKATVRSWLIELTNDLQVLAGFQDMWQQGWTHISSGLIRSVPVMMKGRNKRKVFILMSDGSDSSGPAKVTDKWLTKYNLCEKIREGIVERKETNTKKVEIYYISTTVSASRVKFWADNCTGQGRSITSSDRDSLISVIKGIMSDETGHFSG